MGKWASNAKPIEPTAETNLPRTQLRSARVQRYKRSRLLSRLPLTSQLPHLRDLRDHKRKMAPHADSDKAGLAPNEPGLNEPSAAIQVGKIPK